LFEFSKNYRFIWPVTALIPSMDGQVELTFTGEFRLIPEDELAAALKAEVAESSDHVVCRLAFVGWKDDLLSNGKPVEYSDATRAELLSHTFIRYAVSRAYYTAMNGAIRLKN
jgi:hypothetical protein